MDDIESNFGTNAEAIVDCLKEEIQKLFPTKVNWSFNLSRTINIRWKCFDIFLDQIILVNKS